MTLGSPKYPELDYLVTYIRPTAYNIRMESSGTTSKIWDKAYIYSYVGLMIK